MAVFSKLVTTEKGKELIAHMLSSGEKITFTKVRSSDMEYPLEELKGLEALEGIRQTGSVSKVSRVGNTAVKVETVFTNTELLEGYYMRTVALYAKEKGGEEILYAAAVETSGNCFMPAFGGVTVSGAYVQLVTTVSNAENITLEVDNSVFATIGNIMELQEQIDSVRELINGMAANVSINTKKLKGLEKIGTMVYSSELSFTETIACEEQSEVCSIPLDTMDFIKDDGMNNYLYVLENKTGNLFTVRHENDYAKNLEGSFLITLVIGQYYSAEQIVSIVPNLIKSTGEKTYFSTSVNLMRIAGRPSVRDIKVVIEPYIYERFNGELKETEGSIRISGRMTFRVYKCGELFDDLDESGSLVTPGGTSNYNLLANKPSINNVTLQGNLTSKQLGLGENSSSTPEMTYDEALAILSSEDEEETGT